MMVFGEEGGRSGSDPFACARCASGSNVGVRSENTMTARVKYALPDLHIPCHTMSEPRNNLASSSPSKKPGSLASPIRPLPRFIFMARWLQLPLYLGLILAQCVYVFHFYVELSDLIGAAFGNADSLEHILNAVSIQGAVKPTKLTESTIMLVVLGLIDVVMISNLLIMVIIGGYETFVSRMNLSSHPDQPEWLSHVNASVLKVKLAMAIIGISSIHLLKTFINASAYDVKTLVAQTGIHITFLMSAVAIAYCDRIMSDTQNKNTAHADNHADHESQA